MSKITPAEIELMTVVNTLTLAGVHGRARIVRLRAAIEACPEPIEEPLSLLAEGAREFLAFADGKALAAFDQPAGKEALNCLEAALKAYFRACRAAGDPTRPLPGRVWERDQGLIG